ncbi:MAG: NAD(P)-binding domain-containing protein [Alphaproteobacteria bacterium]
MKIGVIGAGTVGTTLGGHFVAAGHEVLITNSRGPESLARTLAELSQPLEPATFADLVRQAEVLLLAVPWRNVRDVLRKDIDWGGRVIIDATNIILSVSPEVEVDDLQGDSGSQIVARLAPSARVVKAFNTLPFDVMFGPVPTSFRRVLFVAGDSPNAVSTVSDLIAEIGFRPVAIGELATAGRQMEIGGVFSRLELFAAEAR